MRLKEAGALVPLTLVTAAIAAGCGDSQQNNPNPEIKTVTPGLVKQVAEHYVQIAERIRKSTPRNYAFKTGDLYKIGCADDPQKGGYASPEDLSSLTVESKDQSGGYNISFIQESKKNEINVQQPADTVESILISKMQFIGCTTEKTKLEYISFTETIDANGHPNNDWLISEDINGKSHNFTTGNADTTANYGDYSRINPQELFVINNVASSILYGASTQSNVSVNTFPNIGAGPVYKNNLGLNRTF